MNFRKDRYNGYSTLYHLWVRSTRFIFLVKITVPVYILSIYGQLSCGCVIHVTSNFLLSLNWQSLLEVGRRDDCKMCISRVVASEAGHTFESFILVIVSSKSSTVYLFWAEVIANSRKCYYMVPRLWFEPRTSDSSFVLDHAARYKFHICMYVCWWHSMITFDTTKLLRWFPEVCYKEVYCSNSSNSNSSSLMVSSLKVLSHQIRCMLSLYRRHFHTGIFHIMHYIAIWHHVSPYGDSMHWIQCERTFS